MYEEITSDPMMLLLVVQAAEKLMNDVQALADHTQTLPGADPKLIATVQDHLVAQDKQINIMKAQIDAMP